MPGRGLFVTGTDTGVGKTVAACALLHGLAAQGLRVVGMKPVASGCEVTAEGLRNEDALALAAASSFRPPYEHINPCAFEPPIAPHLAAEEAGRPIDLDALVAAYRRLAAQADLVVVEGAGGWRVPVDRRHTLADLPKVLALPVVLVVGLRLGCLNHALLSAEAIRADGRPLLGWIANALEPEPRVQALVETLRSRLEAPLLGVLPRQPAPDLLAFASRLDVAQVRAGIGGI